ncbi:MAG TPA: hypothetical protein VE646_09265 [Actinomycetota bacterium]|jgi:NADH:ubiquinone oxidoreductase subunit K|nr:hypothetical protein [Actinomycetota bacterium]
MIGLALILLGLGAGLIAIDLLIENVAPASYELTLFGAVIGHVSGRAIVLLLMLVAAASSSIVTYGITVLRRERAALKAREAARTDQILEAHRKLWGSHIEDLDGPGEPVRA